jgi:ceramide glucosyltransferase
MLRGATLHSMKIFSWLVLFVATFPFAYYLIVLYSAARFFGARKRTPDAGFTPSVSNLKPIHGLDPDAYENFASLCRQNYPDFELLFCVGSRDDAVMPILDKLKRDFPQCAIRVIVSSKRAGVNDKVMKLAQLVGEAKHEFLVINDSDVRVDPDYFRTMIAPLRNRDTGAVTCFYLSSDEATFADNLHTIGMLSDFFAGVLVAWQLDGVKFALGTSIATTRAHLAEFGGYDALVNRPADDLLVGRLIAEQGHLVELLPYSVWTVADFGSMSQLLHKRLRWIVVMRHMRPWGHLGLIFTHGLPWSLAAIAVHPTPAVAIGYVGTYLALRLAMTWTIGVWGLGKRGLWKRMPLIVAWDAVAFCIWLASFTRNNIRWRDGDYRLLDGQLVPIAKS